MPQEEDREAAEMPLSRKAKRVPGAEDPAQEGVVSGATAAGAASADGDGAVAAAAEPLVAAPPVGEVLEEVAAEAMA